MALFRFKAQTADFLVTLNTEVISSESNTQLEQVTAFFTEIVNTIDLPSREAFLALFPS